MTAVAAPTTPGSGVLPETPAARTDTGSAGSFADALELFLAGPAPEDASHAGRDAPALGQASPADDQQLCVFELTQAVPAQLAVRALDQTPLAPAVVRESAQGAAPVPGAGPAPTASSAIPAAKLEGTASPPPPAAETRYAAPANTEATAGTDALSEAGKTGWTAHAKQPQAAAAPSVPAAVAVGENLSAAALPAAVRALAQAPPANPEAAAGTDGLSEAGKTGWTAHAKPQAAAGAPSVPAADAVGENLSTAALLAAVRGLAQVPPVSPEAAAGTDAFSEVGKTGWTAHAKPQAVAGAPSAPAAEAVRENLSEAALPAAVRALAQAPLAPGVVLESAQGAAPVPGAVPASAATSPVPAVKQQVTASPAPAAQPQYAAPAAEAVGRSLSAAALPAAVGPGLQPVNPALKQGKHTTPAVPLPRSVPVLTAVASVLSAAAVEAPVPVQAVLAQAAAARPIASKGVSETIAAAALPSAILGTVSVRAFDQMAAPMHSYPMASSTPAAPVPAGFTAQLAKPLFALASAGIGEHTLTVQVNPEKLGPVTVQAHIGNGGIRIEMFAASADGRDALRAGLPELKRDLADAGISASLDLSSNGQSGSPQGGHDGESFGRRVGMSNHAHVNDRHLQVSDRAARSGPGLYGPDTILDVLA